MPTKCLFVFDRTTPVYYSDEQISGHLRIQTTKKLVLTGIRLKLVGSAHVEWLEKYKLAQSIEHNDCTEPEIASVCHSGTQTLLKNCTQLAEGITLEAGGAAFERSFAFRLPAQCVSTCKLPFGEVSYRLQLTLKRQSTFNKIFQHRLVIKNRLDLNALEPSVAMPCIVKSEGGLEFGVPYCGFVPGQLLRFSLKSVNYAMDARQILVLLNQCCEYNSVEPMTKHKGVTTTLAQYKIEKPNALQLDVRGSFAVPLKVPSSTRDADCLVSISYYVAVVAMGMKNKVLEKLSVPIVVGTTLLQHAATVGRNDDGVDDREQQYCYDNFGNSNESIINTVYRY